MSEMIHVDMAEVDIMEEMFAIFFNKNVNNQVFNISSEGLWTRDRLYTFSDNEAFFCSIYARAFGGIIKPSALQIKSLGFIFKLLTDCDRDDILIEGFKGDPMTALASLYSPEGVDIEVRTGSKSEVIKAKRNSGFELHTVS